MPKACGEVGPSSLNHALKAKSLNCKMPFNSQICQIEEKLVDRGWNQGQLYNASDRGIYRQSLK